VGGAAVQKLDVHLLLPEHKSNAGIADYRLRYKQASSSPQKPDIFARRRRRITMKNLVLAAVAALGLTAAVAQMASAATADSQQGAFTQGGAYARTGNGPSGLLSRGD
jgi:hypothetical protein